MNEEKQEYEFLLEMMMGEDQLRALRRNPGVANFEGLNKDKS